MAYDLTDDNTKTGGTSSGSSNNTQGSNDSNVSKTTNVGDVKTNPIDQTNNPPKEASDNIVENVSSTNDASNANVVSNNIVGEEALTNIASNKTISDLPADQINPNQETNKLAENTIANDEINESKMSDKKGDDERIEKYKPMEGNSVGNKYIEADMKNNGATNDGVSNDMTNSYDKSNSPTGSQSNNVGSVNIANSDVTNTDVANTDIKKANPQDLDISDDIFFSGETEKDKKPENNVGINDGVANTEDEFDIDELVDVDETNKEQIDNSNQKTDINQEEVSQNGKLENEDIIVENADQANNVNQGQINGEGINTNPIDTRQTNADTNFHQIEKSKPSMLKRISVYLLIIVFLGGLLWGTWFILTTMFPFGIFDDIYRMINSGEDIVIIEGTEVDDEEDSELTNDENMTDDENELSNEEDTDDVSDVEIEAIDLNNIISKYNNISDSYFRMGREEQNSSMIRYALFVGRMVDSIVRKLEQYDVPPSLLNDYFQGLDMYLSSVEESVKNQNVDRSKLDVFLDSYEDLLVNIIDQEEYNPEVISGFIKEISETSIRFISEQLEAHDIQNEQVRQFINQYEGILQNMTNE